MITRSIALFLLCYTPLSADTIELTDGTSLSDVTIISESLTEVSYKDGRKTAKLLASEIASVVYSSMPTLVEEGLAYLKDSDPSSALAALEEYVNENVPKLSERRYEWAPAFAAYQTVQLNEQLGNLSAVVDAADRMLKNFEDSRYLPPVYLLKAQALQMAGQSADAILVLDTLGALVSSSNLSKRWDLECRLARVRSNDASQGENRRAALAAIQQEASELYPAVKSRAQVAEGESYLIDAERITDANKSKRLRETGQRIFEALVSDKNSDDATLAGAHTGLGDCLFFAGAASDDRDTLREAAMNYLRVITLHQSRSEYVAKSLFFALRCFELMGETNRVRDMKRDLLRLYPDSKWAKRQEVTRAG